MTDAAVVLDEFRDIGPALGEMQRVPFVAREYIQIEFVELDLDADMVLRRPRVKNRRCTSNKSSSAVISSTA